jgi:hypothetical protein
VVKEFKKIRGFYKNGLFYDNLYKNFTEYPFLSSGVPLIIFTGESNSGGQANNSPATEHELSDRPAVQILNNYTLKFEDLNISTGNNLYGHYGLDPTYLGVYHGWELGMANLVESDMFLPAPCYLVKTGQGGSRISQWNDGGSYYTSFKNRVDAAISEMKKLTGAAPRLYIIYSQGINDAINNLDVATWKAATIAHIGKIRDRYGANVPFVMTRFMNTFALSSDYNSAILEIASELDDVYTVDGSDLSLQNSYQWDYEGMKKLSARLLNVVLTLV